MAADIEPLVIVRPFAEARELAETPPLKEEVAVVVAVKNAATASPTTESFAYGEVVPMPTLPL
ncbi:MAG: hypothetical protein AAB538_05320, partial [Patescibacteria group bacterium]